MRPLPDVQVPGPHQQPDRTRFLVLASAWWTLAQMEDSGLSFHDFVRAAVGNDDKSRILGDELTRRLHALTAEDLETWPEAVLTPEAKQFIEAVVATMGGSGTARDKEPPK